MQKTDTLVANGRRPLCNLRFADDIDLTRGSEEEHHQLTERLEISSDKGKILVSSINRRPSTNIWIGMNGEVLE